jgi:hypothetical protein
MYSYITLQTFVCWSFDKIVKFSYIQTFWCSLQMKEYPIEIPKISEWVSEWAANPEIQDALHASGHSIYEACMQSLMTLPFSFISMIWMSQGGFYLLVKQSEFKKKKCIWRALVNYYKMWVQFISLSVHYFPTSLFYFIMINKFTQNLMKLFSVFSFSVHGHLLM